MIGETLRAARVRQGLSLGALALKAGVNKSTLSRWESGKTVPYAPELNRVMEALDLSPSARQKCRQSLDAPRALQIEHCAAQTAPVSSGELLRALRVRSRVRQDEAAQAAGVTQSMVSRWEAGECWPEGDKLHALCFALGATGDEVLFLTTRGWQQQEPLPLDKEALEEIVHYLDYHDTMPDRSLTYLALAGRYHTLLQTGKLSEAEASAIWGIYGYYLSWRFNRHAEGARVAAPARASLKQTRGPLSIGQLEAVTAAVEHGRHGKQGADALRLLSEVEHRMTQTHRAWWLTCVADAAESVGNLALATATYQEAIYHAPNALTLHSYQNLFIWLLCRNGLYREAHSYLVPVVAGETRPIVKATNYRNHAWVLAGLGERNEGQRYLSQMNALDDTYQLGLDTGGGMTRSRLERWLTA